MDEWILMGMAKQPQLGRRRGMEAQEIIVVIVIIVLIILLIRRGI